MDEEILLKEQLTKEMIDVGGRLVDQLVQDGMPIYVAMWFFTPETNKWWLLISTPLDDTDDPYDARQRINNAKRALGREAEELLYMAVGILSTRDELVHALMNDPYLPRGGKPVRLTRSAVRGRFIDDALVYRRVAHSGEDILARK